MCGFSTGNWLFSITTLVVFAALVVASVAFLIRSMGKKNEGNEDEKA